jgi:hypothetical protein
MRGRRGNSPQGEKIINVEVFGWTMLVFVRRIEFKGVLTFIGRL